MRVMQELLEGVWTRGNSNVENVSCKQDVDNSGDNESGSSVDTTTEQEGYITIEANVTGVDAVVQSKLQLSLN